MIDLDAVVAGALDRMTLAEFAALTDRQLVDLYCHPRDREGRIKPRVEARTATPETAAAELMAFASAFGLETAALDAIRRREAEEAKDGSG